MQKDSDSKKVNAKKVNAVEGKDDESTDEECTYRITLHLMRDKIQQLTEITIGDKTVTCLIDSGTGVNVIDTCFFNRLKNMHIQPTSKRIYGYRSAKPLPVVGKFEAEIKSSVTSKSTVTQFCVVEG